MKNNYVFIDFEYSQSTEKFLKLVCCVLYFDDHEERYWLHDNICVDLYETIYTLHCKDYIFVSFNVVAEARSLISMHYIIHNTGMKWIDLYLEWRNIVNHNNFYAYGKQYIDGKVVETKPPKPKWDNSEDDDNHSKTPTNLSGAVYKLLGHEIDTDHKNKMRDLIISNPETYTGEQKKDILNYCASDVKYLPELLKKVASIYKKLYRDNSNTLNEMLLRGDFASRTATIETLGYPINVEATRNFGDSVQYILNDISREINSYFPDVRPFNYNMKENYFSMNQKGLRVWISEQGFSYWPKTPPSTRHPNGQISLKLEDWQKRFDYRHDYPTDSLGAQIVRYLKVKQSLNGFMPIKKGQKRKSFWASVGSDGRARPYLNIYGSQSARNQPSATGFIPLKAAWMRSLIQPKEGRVIGNFDYGSEEFLISALLSEDTVMLDAYRSGDVYLYFAKQAGAVPQDGTKEKYKEERDKFKATTLGISYDMSCYGLAKKLTNDLGKPVSEEEAQELINLFFETFWKFGMWKESILAEYRSRKYLKIPCGWTMWGDNPNERSVGNFPVQGAGSSIMRKAVEFAQDAGLEVIYTLHDAIYIEFDKDDLTAMDKLSKAMIDAFAFYFKGVMREEAKMIRLDGNVWGPDFPEEDGEYITPKGINCKRQRIYIDSRSKKEYEKFSKYFTQEDYSTML